MIPARGWFYPGMSVVCLITVFIGFAPTYYLRPSETDALPVLTHVHAAVFTVWMLLLLVQVSLVAAARRHTHRALGVVGAVLAVAMIVLGVVVALASTRREVAAGNGDEALAFLLIPLGGMVSFAVLVGCALAFRGRANVHRRFMLLATMSILPAAIGRIPGLEAPGPFLVYFIALLAAAPVHDVVSGRRPHPVSLWGGLAVVAYELGRFMVSDSAAWRVIAERLV
jgi:hypothetical protein